MYLLSNIRQNISSYSNYRYRYQDGERDLVKGLLHGSPITKCQQKEIMDFWKPVLNSYRKRKSFDIRWFDIYNKTNKFGFDLKYYIPDSFYYCIIDTVFSNAKQAPILDDKNLYDLYFHDAPQPRTICRKIDGVYLDSNYQIISESKVLGSCAENGKVIIKPSVNALGGRGISYWDINKNDVSTLLDTLKTHSSVVVQDVVKQHKLLSSFNDSSVNTLRLVTILFEGVVYLTTSVVIMGGKDSLTNHLHGGGLVCGILPNGQLRDTAFDSQLNIYKSHPNGPVFSECTLPNYDKCVDLVKYLAPRFARISKLISWDLTIGEDGNPILIEANLTWGGSVQIAGGPVFGQMTPQILKFVTNNYKY